MVLFLLFLIVSNKNSASVRGEAHAPVAWLPRAGAILRDGWELPPERVIECIVVGKLIRGAMLVSPYWTGH